LEWGNEQKLKSYQKNGKGKCMNNNEEKRKPRRGNWRKKSNTKLQEIQFSLLGNNCNGIFYKQESLKETMMTFKPSILTLQETKVRKHGTLKIKGYQMFENSGRMEMVEDS
jgi:hypothetical protein